MKIELLIFSLLVIISTLLVGCTANASNGEKISIDVDSLSGQAQFFEHEVDGVTVKFFAAMGSDGEPRVAYDACDVCGGSKGYHQEGDMMVCNNCGQKFKIDGLGTQNKGYGCWPSYLETEVKDGQILIKESTLDSAKGKFI